LPEGRANLPEYLNCGWTPLDGTQKAGQKYNSYQLSLICHGHAA
jgi:hypothetical protein